MSKLSIVLPKGIVGPWFRARAERALGSADAPENRDGSARDAAVTTADQGRALGSPHGSCLSSLSTHGTRTWN
jgi:hypothetical protein